MNSSIDEKQKRPKLEVYVRFQRTGIDPCYLRAIRIPSGLDGWELDARSNRVERKTRANSSRRRQQQRMGTE
ncbi:hypothetical protein K0M31_012212 [Melipona bicolor]|uniref:Uncharacterized protein n=1 Tax=Melipona bicolor TaxID=60889 RepID=A0AA40FK38_9HYME|nr:hypothetical protein K0M31_012212 [Melipona bicolor]